MQQYKQRWKFIYPMEAAAQTPKSRGHSLFDRQAQRHANDSGCPSAYTSNTILDSPTDLPTLRAFQSCKVPSQASKSPNIGRSRLIVPSQPSAEPPKNVEPVQETDFPLIEIDNEPKSDLTTANSLVPTNSLCCAMIDSAFNYLPTQNDDDDVIMIDETERNGEGNEFENENLSEGAESVDTIDLDAGINNGRQIPTDVSDGLSTMIYVQRENSKENIFDQYELSTGANNDDDDSSSENQLHDDEIDDRQDETQEKNEQAKQSRKQKILCSIEQEWLRKENTFLDELDKLSQQLVPISAATGLLNTIQKLIYHHRTVQQQIEFLYNRDHQSIKSIKQLTNAIDALMQTISIYDDCIQSNLVSVRKALERRSVASGMSTEDLLSILPKQFLQILSQIQDLYKTAMTLESDDQENLKRLCDFSHKCKLLGSRQDESINKIILKNEDVAILGTRGNRDRCHLILYPDVIVCCYLKSRLLLAGPRYILLWFIPIIDLQWNIPQVAPDDTSEDSSEIKSNLQTAYRELEKNPANPTIHSTRTTKNIRRQEIEYNLAQSNLKLILSYSLISTRTQYSYVILFTSAYQRHDWIDLIEKTQKDLVQRSSTLLDPVNAHHQRLTENLIQKRVDFIKPVEDNNSNADGSIIAVPNKTYSGTLEITIHSLQGSALKSNETSNYQFYVAVEIDSYKTFHPYAQTTKQTMEQTDKVAFKGEIFEVELEHSVAFRFLIYRIDMNNTDNHYRAQCIGKFHRNIETALRDCSSRSGGHFQIVSPNDAIRLEISLKYSKREDTFHRRPSKRNKTVFGKTIDQLINTPNGIVDGIPRIIFKCVEIVDREGLEETGIYRVCCVTSDLQKLRQEFDRNQRQAEGILEGKNVHIAANLLKLFLRELHEPLFTSTFYQDWVHAIQLTDVDNQRVALLRTFELLHQDNRRILLFLIDHLLRVSQHSSTNMMHLDNLAVVFGPTLMRPSKPVENTYYSSSRQACHVSQLDVSADTDQMSFELRGSMEQCRVVLAYFKLRRDGLLK